MSVSRIQTRRFVDYIIDMQRNIICFLLFILLGCSNGENQELSIDNHILTELYNQQGEIDSGNFSFLHISDTHGSAYTLKYFVKLLENSSYRFGMITGDILMTDEMQHFIDSSTKPIFLLPGNHDVFDWHDQNGQIAFRQTILNQSKRKSQIHLGDETGNYYYVDIKKGEDIYRLICLDQYEINSVGMVPQYYIVMSQKQIDWFIFVLDGASSYDGIIVAMHSGFGNSRVGSRDFNNNNNFITITGGSPDSYEFYGDSNPCMIPDIVEAYISGTNFSRTYASGKEGVVINVKTKFNSSHNNFIGYFGGHTHWDCVERLNYHPSQLQFLISSANYLYPSKYDDMYRESQGINAITINGYIVESDERTITGIRLGARKIVNGTIRNKISFKY